MGLPVGDLEQTEPTMKSGYDIMLRIRCHSSKKKTQQQTQRISISINHSIQSYIQRMFFKRQNSKLNHEQKEKRISGGRRLDPLPRALSNKEYKRTPIESIKGNCKINATVRLLDFGRFLSRYELHYQVTSQQVSSTHSIAPSD